MSWLIAGVVFLIVGYFTYGKLVEKILEPDDRATPAVANPDGVDYVVNPRFQGKPTCKPSAIIAFGERGEVNIIRK